MIARPAPAITHRMGLRSFLTNRRWLVTLAGTAGCWFLLDYAYYGNTISTPQIIGLISPHASTMTKIAIQLAIFVVAAVPGYLLGVARMDRIGHRRLQLDRLRHDGAVLRRHRAGAGPDHRGGAVPAGVRGQLLLHRVRAEHDHVRDAQRGVPGHHAGDRARHLGRESASSAPSSACSSSRCCSHPSGCAAHSCSPRASRSSACALTLVLPEPAVRSLDEVSGGEIVVGSLAGDYPSVGASPSVGPFLVGAPSELRPGAPPDRAA